MDDSLMCGLGRVAWSAAAVAVAAGAPVRAGDLSTPVFPFSHDSMQGEMAVVVCGDLNGDGRADVAIGETVGNDVRICLASPDGTLGPPTEFQVGVEVRDLALVDVDGDGALDIVAAGRLTGDVAVRLGLGDGSFGPAVFTAAGTGPDALALGDFDGDGDVDVAAATSATGELVILVNDGAGTLGPGAVSALPGAPRDLAAGDLDHDGDIDFAALDAANGVVRLFLNNGGLEFIEWLSLPGGKGLESIVVADVDGDLDDDIVAANDEQVIVFRQVPGTFVAADVPAGMFPGRVRVADVTGDGRSDILAVNRLDEVVSVMRGLDGGGFAAPVAVRVTARPRGIAAGDIDGDGHADLTVIIAPPAQTIDNVTTVRSLGGGAFERVPHVAAGDGSSPALLHDLDADGDADLVAADRGGAAVDVAAGDGGGGFSGRVSLGVAPDPIAVAAGAMVSPGPGRADLVVASGAGAMITVFPNDGAGGFGAPLEHAAGGMPAAMVVLDLDDDGLDDVVVARAGASGVWTRRNEGGGALGAPQAIGAKLVPDVLLVMDADGDGRRDVLAVERSAGVAVALRAPGDGTLVEYGGVAIGSDVRSVAVGDVDDDGLADIVLSAPQRLAVHLNLGGGAFGPAMLQFFEIGESAIALGDMDLDGDLDVLMSWYDADYLVVFRNTGGGLYLLDERRAYRTGRGPVHPRLADVSGDGIVDAVVGSAFDGGVSVLVHRATALDPACPADVAQADGEVDEADLVAVLTSWGPCPKRGGCPTDIDGTGAIDFRDMLRVLAAWGPCP